MYIHIISVYFQNKAACIIEDEVVVAGFNSNFIIVELRDYSTMFLTYFKRNQVARSKTGYELILEEKKLLELKNKK